MRSIMTVWLTGRRGKLIQRRDQLRPRLTKFHSETGAQSPSLVRAEIGQCALMLLLPEWLSVWSLPGLLWCRSLLESEVLRRGRGCMWLRAIWHGPPSHGHVHGLYLIRPSRVLFVIVAIALALGEISGCTLIAVYEANHPYYRFPGGGGGGGGNGG